MVGVVGLVFVIGLCDWGFARVGGQGFQDSGFSSCCGHRLGARDECGGGAGFLDTGAASRHPEILVPPMVSGGTRISGLQNVHHTENAVQPTALA